MEKLTDNEIIKAKEHFRYGISHDIFKEPVLSYAKTVLWAFEEINRQKAEIESLTEKLEVLGDPLQDAQYKIAEQQAEIEKLSNCVVMQEKLLKENEKWMESVVKNIIAVEKSKAEVIKEFAKTFVKNAKVISTGRCRETPTFNKISYDIKLIYQISKDEFDNLVKEMVDDIPKIEHNSLCETETYEVDEE